MSAVAAACAASPVTWPAAIAISVLVISAAAVAIVLIVCLR